MSEISITSDKPKLSFWQIWNMSFGFLGIQFGFALQNANTSRIFETLGADTKNLAFYWLAAPVTGLIMQPIIGYLSDRTWESVEKSFRAQMASNGVKAVWSVRGSVFKQDF